MMYSMSCTGFVKLMEENNILENCRDWQRAMRLLPLVLLCMILSGKRNTQDTHALVLSNYTQHPIHICSSSHAPGTKCAATDEEFTAVNVIERLRSQALYFVEANNPPMSVVVDAITSFGDRYSFYSNTCR